MRFLSKVLPLLALGSVSGFADTIVSTDVPTAGPDTVVAPITATDLSGATAFSTAMTGALITTDGLELGLTPPKETTLAQWGGVRTAPRRAKPITPPPTTLPDPVVPNPTSVNEPAAVPEPSTFLTGVLLFGVCANSRNRGSKRRNG